MPKMKDAAAEFLANKRVAVTGVSRKGQSHGANVVYQRLRQRGYQVFAVNPNADEVEGDPCYHDLRSIPGGVDWVVIGTRPETANAAVRECEETASSECGCTSRRLALAVPPSRQRITDASTA